MTSAYALKFLLTLLGVLTCVVLAVQLALSSERRSSGQPAAHAIGCHVLVSFDWSQLHNSNHTEKQKDESIKLLFRTIGILIQEEYQLNQDAVDSASFPLVGTRFDGDYAIFNMLPDCQQSRKFVGNLFDEYKERLNENEKLQAPDVRISDKSATKYEAYCGLGANIETCPEADKIFQ
jgi:hypothetical protein